MHTLLETKCSFGRVLHTAIKMSDSNQQNLHSAESAQIAAPMPPTAHRQHTL